MYKKIKEMIGSTKKIGIIREDDVSITTETKVKLDSLYKRVNS